MRTIFENAIKSVKPDGTFRTSKIPNAYEMSVSDITALMDLAMSDQANIYTAIQLAFDFGFVMGNRATLARGLDKL